MCVSTSWRIQFLWFYAPLITSITSHRWPLVPNISHFNIITTYTHTHTYMLVHANIWVFAHVCIAMEAATQVSKLNAVHNNNTLSIWNYPFMEINVLKCRKCKVCNSFECKYVSLNWITHHKCFNVITWYCCFCWCAA